MGIVVRSLVITCVCWAAMHAVEVARPVPVPPLFDRVLAFNRVLEPELDPAAMRQAFSALATTAREAIDAIDNPRDQIDALNEILLHGREVGYLSNLYWRDCSLAAALLRRQGNCLATSTLYVLIGRALELPIHMVTVPGHAYVRWEDDTSRINIETTAGGVEHSDATYLQRSQRPTADDVTALGWGSSLTDDQLLAELHTVAARHLFSAGDEAAGLRQMHAAIELAPERSDYRLQAITMRAGVTGQRQQAARDAMRLLRTGPPPSVMVGALSFLAQEAAAREDFASQRRLLLEAFAQAPKTAQQGVLMRLASCHRSLRDHRGAVRYMELAVALTPAGSPRLADLLYGLAIYQKNDNRLEEALRSIDRALEINPESWNLTVLKAGYLVLAQRRDEGEALFATITAPRDDHEFYLCMRAWFHAVSDDRASFYTALDTALAQTDTTRALIWIEQDRDLDPYREDRRFRELLERHRARVLGSARPEAHPSGARGGAAATLDPPTQDDSDTP